MSQDPRNTLPLRDEDRDRPVATATKPAWSQPRVEETSCALEINCYAPAEI